MHAHPICMIIIMLVAVNQANALSMDQLKKSALNVRKTCTTKTNADPDAVAGIQNGEFSEDESLKCYALCVLKTMRSFKNGQIDLPTMIKQMDLLMPPEMVTPLKNSATSCANQSPASNDCETALQFVKCNYQLDSDHFFFP